MLRAARLQREGEEIFPCTGTRKETVNCSILNLLLLDLSLEKKGGVEISSVYFDYYGLQRSRRKFVSPCSIPTSVYTLNQKFETLQKIIILRGARQIALI
jgi:hypothetical protein